MIDISKEEISNKMFFINEEDSAQPIAVIKVADLMKHEVLEEKPFITECRNTAIEKNLPLYFVYYKETGVFEVYVTETKELFEKRHLLSRDLSNYEFEKIATRYLNDYTDWRAKNE